MYYDYGESMSYRLRIIALSGLLIILGAVLPVCVMLYLSWSQTINTEQQQLKSYAQIMITRAHVSV